MSFTSVTFIFYFLPLFLAIYLIASKTYLRNVILLIASLCFYAWGELGYVWILLLSVAINYGIALWIAATQGKKRSALLWLGIVLNLSGLIVFKYLNFLLRAGDPVLELLGLPGIMLKLPLPIGISFFTFKAISYVIDVYRKDVTAERDPVVFATYLAMFPQILAGPIARFADAAREMRVRSLSFAGFRLGAEHFIIGMGQKLLIANTVAGPAATAFSMQPSALSAPVAWLGAACYTLQIYFDFAGYTNMAIGLGHMLGFTFPRNFNYPYAAQSITDFWRRWHITLSTWLRDYVWFPLGANRRGRLRTYVNLLVVFALCGLWHGANYTFIVWGLFHGFLLVLERAGLLAMLSRIGRPLRTAYAVLMVMVGWVLFRAESLAHARHFLAAMAGVNAAASGEPALRYLTPDLTLAIVAGVLFSFSWPAPVRLKDTRGLWSRAPVLLRAASATALIAVFVISLMALAAGSHNPFLYFRF